MIVLKIFIENLIRQNLDIIIVKCKVIAHRKKFIVCSSSNLDRKCIIIKFRTMKKKKNNL